VHEHRLAPLGRERGRPPVVSRSEGAARLPARRDARSRSASPSGHPALGQFWLSHPSQARCTEDSFLCAGTGASTRVIMPLLLTL
jgi:hypothetical protein